MTDSKELLQYTKQLNLLFAEDHQELRESMTEVLENFFHQVDAVDDGEQALTKYKSTVQENFYDIVLTDIIMPHMDGIELTKKIYEINPNQHIIILSAYDEAKHLVPLINMGVSYFIKKPIDYQELLNALLKISKNLLATKGSLNEAETSIIKFDIDYIYNRDKKTLQHQHKNVYLTKYEITFLNLLTSHMGKIFSNEDITNYYLASHENIDSRNIRKLVSKLRKKLPPNSIESIYGIGYKLISKE
jgi:DNA-binding response OmpR family regulator